MATKAIDLRGHMQDMAISRDPSPLDAYIISCYVQVPAEPGWSELVILYIILFLWNVLIMFGGLNASDRLCKSSIILYFLALEELDLTPWKPLGQKVSRCVFSHCFNSIFL